VSLRSELHAAYDELVTADAGLSERVVTTVVRERPRRAAWSVRLRAPLSLVAVLAVIALVAGALMGGRLIADWRAYSAPRVPAAPQTPLQKLEARALHLQRLAPHAYCPQGPFDQNGDAGTGPIHTSGSSVELHTNWGFYYFDAMWADRPIEGPILLRGRDLVTGQPIVFVGDYAAGPSVGSDVVDGQVVQQHVELVIEAPALPYAWQLTAGVQNNVDCEGWQFDGPGFTETIVI
jgi:hypothetical protein